ncbi:MAG TPA: GNAT family N-acetyltransferase [Opitutaceae bacterium]|jgi:hypothetical protein
MQSAVVDPTTAAGWDHSVLSMPGATVFHGAGWARALRAAYGYRPLYLIQGSPERPDAVLPLMEISSWVTGRRGVSLPFTDECPPVGCDRERFASLLGDAQSLARQRSWKQLQLRGGAAWLSPAPASDRFFGHQIDLTGGETAVLGRCDAAVRRAIRKAGHEGVAVEFSTAPAAVDEFYRLLCLTRRRHGSPPQPRRFFRLLQREILAPGAGIVVLAHHQGRAIAGAIYFHSGTYAIYKYGASDETFQHLRGNNLIMWSAFQHYLGRGCAVLDLGRTDSDNEGLRRFKLSWGATERTVDYFCQNLASQQFLEQRPFARSPSALFRRLPLPLARLAGELLYKHVG